MRYAVVTFCSCLLHNSRDKATATCSNYVSADYTPPNVSSYYWESRSLANWQETSPHLHQHIIRFTVSVFLSAILLWLDRSVVRHYRKC